MNWTLPAMVSLSLVFTGLAAEQVSLDANGKPGRGASAEPSISADGRFVAFSSVARLTAEDTNNKTDVYLRDRVNGTTRLLTDDRGGDQPAISANGRYVTYRELGDLPVVRRLDVERPERSSTASFPSDFSQYDRSSDSGVISPDGRFVGFIFRSSPTNVGTLNHQIVVSDMLPDAPYPQGPIYARGIVQLTRVAIAFDGERVVFETTDRLTGDDTNDGSDIYLVERSNPDVFRRLSRPTNGLDDPGGSRDPVISHDGNSVFFIAPIALTGDDDDGRETIYRVSGANLSVLSPIITDAKAAALAVGSSPSGKVVAFLGKKARSGTPAYVIRLADSAESLLTKSTSVAPVLSSDDRVAAFTNGAQVVVTEVPGAPPPRTPPIATVTSPASGVKVALGTPFTASGTASTTGSLTQHTLELGGFEKGRSLDGDLTIFALVSDTRGIFTVQTRAFNDAWIEGVSAPRTVIVQRLAGGGVTTDITGVTQLTRTDAPDGSASFSATLRLDRRVGSVSGPLQVIVTAASTPAVMTFAFANLDLVPDRDENVLAVVDVGALAGSANTTVDIAGDTPITETIGDGFQGVGWTVIARLREDIGGGNWVDRDTFTVMETSPRLNDNTLLPNGGAPVFGTPGADGGFNPQVLNSVQISGRGVVGTKGAANYSATANYSTGSKPCNPAWSLENADGIATISSGGVLTAGDSNKTRDITVRANYGGRSATFPVTIKPSTPKVFVRVLDGATSESGDGGSFKIARSKITNEALIVSYSVAGKATNGVDFATLDGTATIPAGASSVIVPVTPVQDADAEGSESIIVRIQPAGPYRLSAEAGATLLIADDEALPDGQPDLTLKFGRGPAIGRAVIDYPAPGSQTLKADGRKNQKLVFKIGLINPGSTPQNLMVKGRIGAGGFTVRYLLDRVDVTADVGGEGTMFPGFPAGGEIELRVEISATGATPIGGRIACDIHVASESWQSDIVTPIVERVR